jgi:membrane-associated protease RseP (regulator of RpoE activity)
VEVTMVDQDAPAGKAGIKEHDVILSINGSSVESVEQLRRMIREIPPGRVVAIGLSRNGQPLTLKAQLADRKTKFAFVGPDMKEFKWEVRNIPNIASIPDIDIPMSVVVVHSSARSGMMVENLTAQLGDFFGAKGGQGVLVRSVEKGSAAEKAGFRAGDVVVRVNNEAVNDTADFTRMLRSRSGNTISVAIIRDKKEQTLTLTLPERKRSGSLEGTVPEIDIETESNLDELKDEMEQVRPQIEAYTAELKRITPEVTEAAREALREQIEQIQQQREQLDQQKQKLQEELRRQQDDLRRQQEDLQNQMEDQRDQIREHIRIQLPGEADI